MKRQKRLEKNREIAKNCRKRKKEKKEAASLLCLISLKLK